MNLPDEILEKSELTLVIEKVAGIQSRPLTVNSAFFTQKPLNQRTPCTHQSLAFISALLLNYINAE